LLVWSGCSAAGSIEAERGRLPTGCGLKHGRHLVGQIKTMRAAFRSCDSAKRVTASKKRFDPRGMGGQPLIMQRLREFTCSYCSAVQNEMVETKYGLPNPSGAAHFGIATICRTYILARLSEGTTHGWSVQPLYGVSNACEWAHDCVQCPARMDTAFPSSMMRGQKSEVRTGRVTSCP
jgi:hypothetical protein